MKRFFVFLSVLLLLGAIVKTEASAVDENEIYKESGASELQESSEDISLTENVWKILSAATMSAGVNAVKYGGFVIAALLLISLANGLMKLNSEETNGAFDFISAAALCSACFPALFSTFNYTKAAIESFCVFSASLLPVTSALYAMGGNSSQGLAAGSGFNLFLSATEIVNAKLLLPMLSIGVALALTGLLPGSEHIAPAASIVKNWVCVFIAFVFSLVGFVFYFQTAVAASADNINYRAAKFAFGTFVPVIGNVVGDSARTVFGAVSSVKSSVGILGVSAMFAYILPPLVSAMLYKMMFAFCSFFAKLCGLEKQGRFLSELGGVLSTCLALLLSCAVVFTVISAVFLKSGVQV